MAIQGERFDGHDFVDESLQRGASGVVVREGWSPPEGSLLHDSGSVLDLISVSNTLRALQDLSHAVRTRYSIPVVAVTGTNGKTSTKEMIFSILNIGQKAYRSSGNLNNHIGVPLSLFGIQPQTEVAVLEFGMSGFGEIRRLREIAKPTVVVITNVSAAHLMTLRSVEEVGRAKSEILENLPEDGWAILNRDDPRVYALRERVPGQVITFGLDRDADVTAENIQLEEEGTSFELKHDDESETIRLNLPGLHQVSNALAAAAVSLVLGRTLATIAKGLSSHKPLALRWESSELPGGAVAINDAYNANPESMKAAIRTVEMMEKGKRNIAVLGDMLELGEYSEEGHREVGRAAGDGTFEILITVGEQARWIAEAAEEEGMDPARIFRLLHQEEAVSELRKILKKNDRILIKASRGMRLEQIVEELKN